MIKAYHWVPMDALRKIRDAGSIVPAADRLSLEFFKDDCELRIQDLKKTVSFGGTPDPIGLEALERLVRDRLEDLKDWQGRRSFDIASTFTQFGCVDFLAGDLENVFLQVGQWPDWAGDKPTGFVFDAERLIREGAVLREKDLAPRYWRLLQDFLKKTWTDVNEAWDWLLELFHRAKEDHQYRGKSAIAELRRKRRRKEPFELLWSGPLPVDLAVEAFQEGVSVEPQSVLE